MAVSPFDHSRAVSRLLQDASRSYLSARGCMTTARSGPVKPFCSRALIECRTKPSCGTLGCLQTTSALRTTARMAISHHGHGEPLVSALLALTLVAIVFISWRIVPVACASLS